MSESLLKQLNKLERRELAAPRDPPAQDNGPGELMIGFNLRGEVVMNLPRDMTGHIVFTPREARRLAVILINKAAEAEEMGDGEA